MVDKPANNVSFLLTKRDGDGGGINFNETLSDASSAMQATLEQVAARLEEAKKGGNEKAVLKDIVKEDEQETLAKLFDLVQKIFGPYSTKSTTPVFRLDDTERSVIERVMVMEGMLEEAKQALGGLLKSEATKFATADALALLQGKMEEFMVNTAEAFSRLAPNPEA